MGGTQDLARRFSGPAWSCLEHPGAGRGLHGALGGPAREFSRKLGNIRHVTHKLADKCSPILERRVNSAEIESWIVPAYQPLRLVSQNWCEWLPSMLYSWSWSFFWCKVVSGFMHPWEQAIQGQPRSFGYHQTQCSFFYRKSNV